MQMLGNVTKFVWNTVDPRPVYKKVMGATTAAAKYESFDTSTLTGGGGGLFSSLTSGSSNGDPVYTPIPDFSGQSLGNVVFICRSLITGGGPEPRNQTPQQIADRNRVIGLCKQNSPYFCKYVNDNSGAYGADYGDFKNTFCEKSVSSSLLSSVNSTGSYFSTKSNNTYTPIPELSGQSMERIISTCAWVSTVPIRQPATPEDVAQYNKLKGECRPNFSYFCNYVKDNSGNFRNPDNYDQFIKTFCVAPEANNYALIGNIAGGVSGVAVAGYIGIAILAFLFASLAANQMLYMPAIMRIMVFIITLTISFVNPFAMIIFFLYFVFIGFLDLFRHYKGIHNKDQFILPATLLPLRLRRPDDGMLIRILLAPFTYIEPNPNDPGRQDYLAGIDQYLSNLQSGAKLSDELLASANLKGLKDSISKGLREPVEELARLFAVKQEGNSLEKDIQQKPLNTSKVNRLVELGRLTKEAADKLIVNAGTDVRNSESQNTSAATAQQ